jgi:hypothetical protein
MAVLFFVVVVCAVFVGLTRLALRFPPHEMDAVLVGLALFTVPALAIYPPAALLWGLCLFGAWSMTDSARIRRLRLEQLSVPDRLPEDWRAG